MTEELKLDGTIIYEKYAQDYDENAEIKGLIATLTITFYPENAKIYPTSQEINIQPPMLLIETIDENATGLTDDNGDPIIGMKPIDAIQLTKTQAQKLQKYIQ